MLLAAAPRTHIPERALQRESFMKKVLSILALLVLACLVRMPVFPLSALAAGEPRATDRPRWIWIVCGMTPDGPNTAIHGSSWRMTFRNSMTRIPPGTTAPPPCSDPPRRWRKWPGAPSTARTRRRPHPASNLWQASTLPACLPTTPVSGRGHPQRTHA